MEKQNREVKIFSNSRLYRLFSPVVYHLFFMLQLLFYPLLFAIRIRGRAHLRGIPQAIFISNHCHYLDPGFIAIAVWPRRLIFTAREATFKRPFLSRLIRLLRCIPIPEKVPGRILKPLGLRLQKRPITSIHIFPEGEMLPFSSGLRPFSSGAFSLARKFNLPVVPITEKLTYRRFLPPKVELYIEAPIYPAPRKAGVSKQQHCEHMADTAAAYMQYRLSHEQRRAVE